jgi:gamma-glutamylcyclotransferase (GGCT)/AIG2-like uncharacterized protein YtfP
MTDLLFVYGTLRRGCWNDIARIAPTAVYAGTARLRGRLFDLGTYPALLLDEQAGWAAGELYRVPADAWKPLDELEEPVTDTRPDGEYFKLVTAAHGADGVTRQAWTYAANPRVLRLDTPIEEGDWIAYARRMGKRP